MSLDGNKELEKLRESISKQSGARALASPLYFVVQQFALVVSINLIFPNMLNLVWHGDYVEQALFVFIYAIAYSIAGMIFLAISALFAIMLEVIKVYRDIKTGNMNPQTAAHQIPYRVMTGNHPRWLIALAPPLVPMLTLAFLVQFFKSNLEIADTVMLLKACALQGIVSYTMSLPFILRAQKSLHEVVSKEEEE